MANTNVRNILLLLQPLWPNSSYLLADDPLTHMSSNQSQVPGTLTLTCLGIVNITVDLCLACVSVSVTGSAGESAQCWSPHSLVTRAGVLRLLATCRSQLN